MASGARTHTKNEKGLTVKQESFCLAYTRIGVGHGNLSEAYRITYNCKGSKPASVHRLAHELMQNPKVRSRISELQADAARNVGLTVEKVLNSLRCAIDFDPAKLYAEDGSLKPLHELDEDTRAVLAAIETVEMGGTDSPQLLYTKKIKWLDKNTARDQAMKHFGLYKRDNEQRTPPEPEMNVEDVARAVAFALASAARKKQPA